MSEDHEKSQPEPFNPGYQEESLQSTGNPPPYEQAAPFTQPPPGAYQPPPPGAYQQPPPGAYQPPPPGAYQQPPPGAYQPPPPGGYPKQNMPQGPQVVQGGMVVTNQPGPVVMTGQPGYPHTQTFVVTTGMTSPPPDYLVFSILTILCCWPIAIAAIVFSCGSRSASSRGDYITATAKGRTAKSLCIAALICGIILYCSNIVIRAV